MLHVTAYTGGALGENCYLLQDDKTGAAALVDPGFQSPALKEAVLHADLRYVLLTHGHVDHAEAARAFCEATGAKLLASEQEAALLADPQVNLSSFITPHTPLSITADRWLQDQEVLTLGAVQLTVLATPGHTVGSCCYYTEGWLFSGDTLMAGSVGRTDFPTGDTAALMASLGRLAVLPDETAVCSGHGPVSSIGREKETNLYLRRL